MLSRFLINTLQTSEKIIALAGYVWTWPFCRYNFFDMIFSSVAPKHCRRPLERGLVLPVIVVPECLSNKALMRLIVMMISETISLDIFPFVGSGKIQVLCISHNAWSPVE